jgi:hypothetical protein
VPFAIGLLVTLLGAPRTDRTLTLAFTGDSWGEVEPCGCPKIKLGGLARQAGVLRAWGRLGQPLALLDAGDLLLRPGAGMAEREEASVRAALTYDLLSEMGMVAAVPGETDLLLGAGFVRDLAAREGVTLLAANLRDSNGEMVFAGSTVVRLADAKVGVIGVLSPSLCPEGLHAEPPAVAIKTEQALLSASGPIDVLVVVAHEPPEEDAPLADAIAADVLIAGHGGVPVPAKQIGTRTLRLRDGNSSRFLGRLDLALGKPGSMGPFAESNASLRDWLGQGDWEKTPGPFADAPGSRRYASALIPLEEGLPSDAKVAQRISEQHAASEARERARLSTSSASAAAGPFTGVTRCAGCHARAHEVWSGTAHAFAYETLVRVGHAMDTDCVGCHSTGYERPGGFDRPARVGSWKEIQCEACHGPGAAHAEKPKEVHLAKVGEATCRGCHTTTRSPSFSYAAYFPRISH